MGFRILVQRTFAICMDIHLADRTGRSSSIEQLSARCIAGFLRTALNGAT
jgi:hypothetical protein